MFHYEGLVYPLRNTKVTIFKLIFLLHKIRNYNRPGITKNFIIVVLETFHPS